MMRWSIRWISWRFCKEDGQSGTKDGPTLVVVRHPFKNLYFSSGSTTGQMMGISIWAYDGMLGGCLLAAIMLRYLQSPNPFTVSLCGGALLVVCTEMVVLALCFVHSFCLLVIPTTCFKLWRAVSSFGPFRLRSSWFALLFCSLPSLEMVELCP